MYLKATTLTKKINMTTYFENLTVELPEFKHLIDYIAIDIWFYWYFASMEDRRRKCILTVDLSNSHLLKNIKISCSHSLQLSLLPNFV